MRRLLLLRHGESRWNAEGRIQGHACAGLSSLGHRQAEVTAQALAAELDLLVRDGLVRVVTSDLQRATETAAPLARRLGVEATEDERLRERSFGAWEGRLRDEVAGVDGLRWHRWAVGDADVLTEIGAETATMLADRVGPALREHLASTPPGGVTIAVSHGGAIWHGLHRAVGLPPRTLGPVGNASLAELLALDEGDADDQGQLGHVVLARYNEQAHLPSEVRTGGLMPTGGSDTVPMTR